jgi:hypothetical protein
MFVQQIVASLFYLCRLDPGRQEMAAKAGVIPHLQSIINSNSPLKQFVLPIVCQMVHVCATCVSASGVVMLALLLISGVLLMCAGALKRRTIIDARGWRRGLPHPPHQAGESLLVASLAHGIHCRLVRRCPSP